MRSADYNNSITVHQIQTDLMTHNAQGGGLLVFHVLSKLVSQFKSFENFELCRSPCILVAVLRLPEPH